MRISGLRVVLLCGLVSVCAAGDAVRQNSSSQAAVNSFSSDWLSPSAIARQDFVQVWPSDRVDRHYSRSDSARDGDIDLLHDPKLPGETREPAFRCHRAGWVFDLRAGFEVWR